MEPIVSVIVSAYNHEKYIYDSLLSIINQCNYSNIELIVLDDGSADKTPEIIEDINKVHDFIFIRKKNSGLSDTLNQGLKLATGKYVCQFGSDDIMMPDKTAKQVKFMEDNPDVVCCGGNALIIDENGQIKNKRQKFPAYREIQFEHIFAETGSGIVASTGMIRKDFLDEYGGWDKNIPLEDIYMWLKITSKSFRMVGLNDVLMYYRKHPNNSYRNTRYMYESMMKTINDYQEHSLYPKVRLKLLRRYFLNAAKYDKALAREILPKIPIKNYNMKVIRGLFKMLA